MWTILDQILSGFLAVVMRGFMAFSHSVNVNAGVVLQSKP